MSSFTDQTGRTLTLNKIPQRVISLVPSQTELLHDLGLEQEVVAITKFCVHPDEWFRRKPRVGGTKQLKMNSIHELKPDLIIANKEENVKEQVEELASQYPVWVSNVNNLEDAYEMIRQIGLLTDKVNKSEEIINGIKSNFSQLPHPSVAGGLPQAKPGSVLRAAYLIWQKPFMTAGGDTFIHSMLEIAGFENIFKQLLRYPQISINDLLSGEQSCQLLLLSSEPFPFRQKHIDELAPLLPNTKIVLADGEMFSWYGSRLLQAPGYFRKLREEIAGAGC